uniref:G patch domain-containing protein 4 n=1 Tax=Oryzias latipes TaxID=8090 RepID=H2MN49_ORYLA
MAGVSEKSRGQAFAEQQLLRHGWEHGKGLGRAENGISEPIKVKVKCGKGGVGHREGEQFSFHWWDHVFNKASSSLQVQAHQVGSTLSHHKSGHRVPHSVKPHLLFSVF